MYSNFAIDGNLPMIQIQDDVANQSVASSQAASASQLTQQNTQNQAPSQKKDNSAEIDKLLAELDKLSKNLEDKPKEETVVSSQSTAPTQAPAAQTSEDEKFDFDSFLTDLENKIDQESKKNEANKDMPAMDIPDSGQAFEGFRKTRPSLDMQNETDDSSDSSAEQMEESAEEKSPEKEEKIAEPATQDDQEELKSQNIFEMLGLTSISDSEKNQFLDELEEMIWDDFVFHDLELLLTSEEYQGARQILDDETKKADEKKEALIVYLEELVPDLDEVLYEKALELKSEMMGERLIKMKEKADQATLDKIKEAENLISENHWKSAASLLNQLT